MEGFFVEGVRFWCVLLCFGEIPPCGELRLLQVLLVSFLISAVIFSVLRLRRLWRASHRPAYACLYIYKKVRKRNFPSGGHFF